MPDKTSAVPLKCARCDKPMSTPVACDFCRALSPNSSVMDHFSLLGLQRRYDISTDELHRRFLAISRLAHPDFHTGGPSEAQELALKTSAAINDAYRTLKDPYLRGAYLLELLGGKCSADDKSVPDGFLGTMVMMQEEVAEAKAAGNAAEIKRLRSVLTTQQDGLIRRVADLFDQHQQAVACQGVSGSLLAELRKQLNAISYVRKLLNS